MHTQVQFNVDNSPTIMHLKDGRNMETLRKPTWACGETPCRQYSLCKCGL